jgi:hypothetical protein
VTDAATTVHVILPMQLLRDAKAGLARPQKRLMLAVLQAVLDDFEWTRPGDRPATPRDRRTRLQAAAYVESRDRSWPYSFENICEATGLDVDGIRRALRPHIADITAEPASLDPK